MVESYKCKIFRKEQVLDYDNVKLEAEMNDWLSEHPDIKIHNMVLSPPNEYNNGLVVVVLYK
ncbi:MAG: hypothetical protein HQL10_13440 [Nitrospirae bacterium]|nr:hypothetical protein [Nitrospirota bacterium]